jgi:tRNA-uridine 2-sulfurtransferase
MARIVMAMSGGVDSSVAAALLHRAGHEVIGVFMRHGEPEPIACATASTSASLSSSMTLPIVQSRPGHKQGCCSASDAEDARRVAQQFDIPFYALNLSDDFARIIDYFVDEYTAARTPNPCVLCNNWLKFGKLFEYADGVGAEFVATGHYARVQESEVIGQGAGVASQNSRCSGGPCPALFRGLDADKDQSYVLFGVKREYLPRIVFPVGGYRKAEIRGLAHEFGLRVADKPDSQDICFVASGDHADFVRRRRAGRSNGVSSDNDLATNGEISLADGTIVGSHNGIEAFTIGQRKGLRVAMGEPYYVTRIEAATGRVIIGRHGDLARTELSADRVNWLIDPPTQPFRADVQIRYNSSAAAAIVTPLGYDRIRVEFDAPQHGVAPGQAAVCYEGNEVLGGGWIE